MKFGSLFDEMNIKSKSLIVYGYMFLFRRVFLTLNAIFMNDY